MGHAIASSVCLPKEHSKGRGALPKDNRKHAQTVTDIVLCLLNQLLDWNMAVLFGDSYLRSLKHTAYYIYYLF